MVWEILFHSTNIIEISYIRLAKVLEQEIRSCGGILGRPQVEVNIFTCVRSTTLNAAHGSL